MLNENKEVFQDREITIGGLLSGHDNFNGGNRWSIREVSFSYHRFTTLTGCPMIAHWLKQFYVQLKLQLPSMVYFVALTRKIKNVFKTFVSMLNITNAQTVHFVCALFNKSSSTVSNYSPVCSAQIFKNMF